MMARRVASTRLHMLHPISTIQTNRQTPAHRLRCVGPTDCGLVPGPICRPVGDVSRRRRRGIRLVIDTMPRRAPMGLDDGRRRARFTSQEVFLF